MQPYLCVHVCVSHVCAHVVACVFEYVCVCLCVCECKGTLVRDKSPLQTTCRQSYRERGGGREIAKRSNVVKKNRGTHKRMNIFISIVLLLVRK